MRGWWTLTILSGILTAQAGAVVVTDFGAAPDDGVDDTAAFIEAFAAVQQAGSGTLVIPPGQYDFAAPADARPRHAPFTLNNLGPVEIRGDGATLIFDGQTSCFGFWKCRDITVRGLTIDWKRPLFSSGIVLAATERSFDVRIDDDYPVRGGEPVEAFMDYDPETRLQRVLGLDVYYGVDRTELIAPQTLRVHTHHPLRIDPGVLVVLRHKVYGHVAFSLTECVDTRFEDVTIHHVPGMGIVAKHSENIAIRNLRVVLPPGSRRLVTTTADATHFHGCTGRVELTDSEFERMGDDAANFKNLYLTVLEKVDERTVLAQHSMKHASEPFPGDVMEYTSVDTLLPDATGTVESFEMQPDNVHRITFVEPIPPVVELGDVLANVTRVPSVRIRNCQVRNNRARGFLIQNRDAVIEDCVFENCTATGIQVMCEVVYFHESLGTRDIVVRNNTFINCNFGSPVHEAALNVFAYLKDFAFPPKPGVHRNITVEGNTIRGANNCGIFVTGVDGLVLRNNVLEGVSANPTRAEGRHAIHLYSTRDAVIEGNTVHAAKQGPGFESALKIAENCETDSFTVRDNIGF